VMYLGQAWGVCARSAMGPPLASILHWEMQDRLQLHTEAWPAGVAALATPARQALRSCLPTKWKGLSTAKSRRIGEARMRARMWRAGASMKLWERGR